jgi:AcrR family transcriptional regulator
LVSATHARILEAAARLARERGVNSFSMDVLAREAGVARATVYEHFRSKRAVLSALKGYAAQQVAIHNGHRAANDPLTALRDTLSDVCAHWASNEPTMQELVSLGALIGDRRAPDGVSRDDLRRLVDELAAAGQLRNHWDRDEATDALAVLTSYETYDRLRQNERSPVEVEAVLAKLAISVIAPGGAATT